MGTIFWTVTAYVNEGIVLIRFSIQYLACVSHIPVYSILPLPVSML